VENQQAQDQDEEVQMDEDTRAHILAILFLGKMHSLGYSRDVESRADLTGSDLCAHTGYNPWGLVLLFQGRQFQRNTQILSDHPDDQSRSMRWSVIAARIARSSEVRPDPKSATPFAVSKNAQEVFLC
jgi:predicted Zn-dependent protease